MPVFLCCIVEDNTFGSMWKNSSVQHPARDCVYCDPIFYSLIDLLYWRFHVIWFMSGWINFVKISIHIPYDDFCFRFRYGQLVEINSHGLFSKWFSESGKLVVKMFQKIQELIEDPEALVCILMDEVKICSQTKKMRLFVFDNPPCPYPPLHVQMQSKRLKLEHWNIKKHALESSQSNTLHFSL